MSGKKKINSIIRLFLPLLFVFYLGGIMMFTHSHVVNGVIVVHSHPGKVEHTHTAGQLETIFFLSHFFTSGEVLPSYPLPLYLCLCFTLPIPALPRKQYRLHSKGIRLRAPPSCWFTA